MGLNNILEMEFQISVGSGLAKFVSLSLSLTYFKNTIQFMICDECKSGKSVESGRNKNGDFLCEK